MEPTLIPLRKCIAESKTRVPCGMCQWMGCSPVFREGRCVQCERTRDEILEEHGAVDVTEEEAIQREPCVGLHMLGLGFQYVVEDDIEPEP